MNEYTMEARRLAATLARSYLDRRITWRQFMDQAAIIENDKIIDELIDLIEHEPKHGGFMGANEEEWFQYQHAIQNLIKKLEKHEFIEQSDSQTNIPLDIRHAIKSVAKKRGLRIEFNTHYDTINCVVSWIKGNILYRLDFRAASIGATSVTLYRDCYLFLPKVLSWADNHIPFFSFLTPLFRKIDYQELTSLSNGENFYFYVNAVNGYVDSIDNVVATGDWLYDGIVPCKVLIVREDAWPGSGDYEDSPDLAEDRKGTCFSVLFESPGRTMELKAGGGYYATIEEAIAAIEAKLSSPVKWKKKR